MPSTHLGPEAAAGRLCLVAAFAGSQPTPHPAPLPGAPASGVLIDHSDNQSPRRNLRDCPITAPEKGMRAAPWRTAGSVAPRLRKGESDGGGAGERGRALAVTAAGMAAVARGLTPSGRAAGPSVTS